MSAFLEKKRYEGIRFNGISVTRGWVGVKFPFKCYVTQMGGVRFSGKKRYEGVMFNVIGATRGWVGVQFAEKYR